jgi:hypothetical protein
LSYGADNVTFAQGHISYEKSSWIGTRDRCSIRETKTMLCNCIRCKPSEDVTSMRIGYQGHNYAEPCKKRVTCKRTTEIVSGVQSVSFMNLLFLVVFEVITAVTEEYRLLGRDAVRILCFGETYRFHLQCRKIR